MAKRPTFKRSDPRPRAEVLITVEWWSNFFKEQSIIIPVNADVEAATTLRELQSWVTPYKIQTFKSNLMYELDELLDCRRGVCLKHRLFPDKLIEYCLKEAKLFEIASIVLPEVALTDITPHKVVTQMGTLKRLYAPVIHSC